MTARNKHNSAVVFFCTLNSPYRGLTNFVLPQETQERQNKSRWELIKESLNKKFTRHSELKASFTSASFYWQDQMFFTSEKHSE